jgi:hypothetical protein
MFVGIIRYESALSEIELDSKSSHAKRNMPRAAVKIKGMSFRSRLSLSQQLR